MRKPDGSLGAPCTCSHPDEQSNLEEQRVYMNGYRQRREVLSESYWGHKNSRIPTLLEDANIPANTAAQIMEALRILPPPIFAPGQAEPLKKGDPGAGLVCYQHSLFLASNHVISIGSRLLGFIQFCWI